MKRLLRTELEKAREDGTTNAEAIIAQTVKLAVMGSPFHTGLIMAADASLESGGDGGETDAIFEGWDDSEIESEAIEILISEGLVKAI